MKKFTVYKFPSYHGSPKEFNFFPFACLYGLYLSLRGYVAELKVNDTGKYKAYWM